MPSTTLQERYASEWPLGNIAVPTPGTPVRITNIVDPSVAFAPEAATNPNPALQVPDYAMRCQQIIFQAFKAGAGPPKLALNTGLIYIVRRSTLGTSGLSSDTGAVIAILQPGQTFVLGSAALNRNVFSPYDYYIDADTAGDACQVTLINQ